jgi:Zn-dependent protease with chaperone function
MENTNYPQSPEQTQTKLTALTPSYQMRASLAIVSIFVFFILYIVFVIGLGYLVYFSFIYDIGDVNKLTILLKISSIVGSMALFVFALKFVFKLKNHVPINRIKLTSQKQPEIWKFVNQICDETGSPRPKSIYIDPDVNAYVKYSNTWLSLFLPVSKELTIGTGIINGLNLSEFKAVISHEFGHFSQKSMRIGSYIMSANTIIHDMIFTRDAWDTFLENWKATDIRLSFGAWILTPIVWGIRQILALFYQLLNFMYSSLSREMEFNADKVAVQTSGSEAIVSALWKLNDAHDIWSKTLKHAYQASQKKLFSSNLYLHHQEALSEYMPIQEEKIQALPQHTLGGKQFFSGSEFSKVSMYASHPSNDLRELSAKTPFVACLADERSPWILFKDQEQLQQDMTKLVYTQYLDLKPENPKSTDEFKHFIQLEVKSNQLLSEYENTFEHRFFTIFPEIEYENMISDLPILKKTDFDELKQELKKLHEPLHHIDAKLIQAQELAMGTTKLKTLEYNGITYTKKNIENAFQFLISEKNRIINETFPEWDKKFAAYHLSLANQLDKKNLLWGYYQQHENINELYKLVLGVKSELYEKFEKLKSLEQVLPSDLNTYSIQAQTYFKQLNDKISSWNSDLFIPLPNIETFDEMKETIVDGGEFKPEKGAIFENGGLSRIFNKLENAIVQLQRLDQKNIGEILNLHQELENQLK